ncbi:MAG: hypothetical protein TREMPRED_005565 [Tremellales sp. Tagirdzhanova-0007]|nr:MAG: hypothetical protein TREMPRED_005565 [Tremellales sp. Tagirdzhanova-0007]
MSSPSGVSPAPHPSDSSSPPHPPRSPITPLSHNPLKPPSHPSSSTLHPLLAPLESHGSGTLTTRNLDPTPAAEKCFTFCSQRQDAPPLCRMLCLRRRQSQLSRAEQVARLRPPRRSVSTSVEEANLPSLSYAASWVTPLSSWAPFESLRRRLEPWSFVYVRGTPDGVVGRYMEEMEVDDGKYDFGAISRGAEHLRRRKREDPEMEFIDWGDHGSLTHLPLTSLFYPILSIPTTVHRLFTPTLNLLGRYRDSFSDGSQSRALAQFREEVERGGAEGVLGKVRDHWGRQLKNQRESIEKQREMEKSQIAQARSEPKNNQPASSGLRQAYLAKERHRKEQQRQVEREGVKKVGKEVEGKGE